MMPYIITGIYIIIGTGVAIWFD